MKKKFIYAALASVILLCSACGKQDSAQNNETITNENAVESSNTVNATTTNTDTNASTDSGTTDANASENNTDSNAQPSDNTEQSISVSIDLQTEEINETAEDGTPIYTSVIIYPVVSIEGNESAAEKINADIQSRVDAFRADTMVLDMAKEGYEYTLTEESEYPFSGYESDLDFTVTRADSNVISFAVTYFEYAGGAHGNYMTIGVNYSPRTGELIDFAELSENADSFHADTLAFIQELANSESYQERLFPDIPTEELESALYADEKWYFSTSGLVFISDPYMLGPYASGTITFTIPYLDLEEMGLKEEYRYKGNLTVELRDGDSYTIDINGDGNEDTIELYTSYDENADGTGDFFPHLIINDIDITQGYNEELSRLLTPWPTVALYDMNENDDTIEIAITLTQTNEATGAADFITTYFFRYENDGSVSSAGMTRGDATDPI